jgi:hypothetical protein
MTPVDPHRWNRNVTTMTEAAKQISALHPTPNPLDLQAAIINELRRNYILGGIAAVESLAEAVPPSALELPLDARRMLHVILTVIDNFVATLKKKL